MTFLAGFLAADFLAGAGAAASNMEGDFFAIARCRVLIGYELKQ